MYLEKRSITLEVPDEVNVSRLWWAVSKLSERSILILLDKAEDLAKTASPYETSAFDKDVLQGYDDEPDDCETEPRKSSFMYSNAV